MIKTLLIGAAAGYFGKKLYDEGKLDPYLVKARSKLDEMRASASSAATYTPKDPKNQPDLAF